jgi:hypothetical protein
VKIKSAPYEAAYYIIFSLVISYKYLPQHFVLTHLELISFLYSKDKVAHPFKTTGKRIQIQ